MEPPKTASRMYADLAAVAARIVSNSTNTRIPALPCTRKWTRLGAPLEPLPNASRTSVADTLAFGVSTSLGTRAAPEEYLEEELEVEEKQEEEEEPPPARAVRCPPLLRLLLLLFPPPPPPPLPLDILFYCMYL